MTNVSVIEDKRYRKIAEECSIGVVMWKNGAPENFLEALIKSKEAIQAIEVGKEPKPEADPNLYTFFKKYMSKS